jgi:hypothetical protein
MASQTPGAVSGSPATWQLHVGGTATDPRWSLPRQAVTGGAPGLADQGRRALPLPVGKGRSEDAGPRGEAGRPDETSGDDRGEGARLGHQNAPGATSGRAVSSDRPSDCATRLSLVRGATGAAPCKAPEGGGVGGPRVDRGVPAPPAGAAAPHPYLPEPRTPRDFPTPPLLGGSAPRDLTQVKPPAPETFDPRAARSGREVPLHLDHSRRGVTAARGADLLAPARPSTSSGWGASVASRIPRSTIHQNPKPLGSDPVSQVRLSRAKAEHGKDRGRVHGGAMGPTEDTARRSACSREACLDRRIGPKWLHKGDS